jgi:hypothetical protein
VVDLGKIERRRRWFVTRTAYSPSPPVSGSPADRLVFFAGTFRRRTTRCGRKPGWVKRLGGLHWNEKAPNLVPIIDSLLSTGSGIRYRESRRRVGFPEDCRHFCEGLRLFVFYKGLVNIQRWVTER